VESAPAPWSDARAEDDEVGERPVLVVDDDASVANLVATVLRRSGMPSEIALDGDSALERLTDGDYRAVLTDMTMPGMSGLQLVRRAVAMGCAGPYLIMTAYLDPATERVLSSETSIAAILRKPFDVGHLVGQVRSVIDGAVSSPPGWSLVPLQLVAQVAATIGLPGPRPPGWREGPERRDRPEQEAGAAC
jgi:DNA-binding response OmpR family regulator